MTLDEIFAEWKKDSRMDFEQLDKESLNISVLHMKYYKFLSQERLLMKDLELKFRKKKLEVFEYFIQGPSKETALKRDPKDFPARGAILKTDCNMYVDADEEIGNLQLTLDLAKEKVDVLTSIITMIGNRSFTIKDAIAFRKFKEGLV